MIKLSLAAISSLMISVHSKGVVKHLRISVTHEEFLLSLSESTGARVILKGHKMTPNEIYKIHPITDYQQWSQYFFSVKKPNLLQSWSYGNAKMKSQGWKLMRGIIYENDQPVALIQIWYKKFLLIKFARLSYGPLWIIEHPSLEQIR